MECFSDIFYNLELFLAKQVFFFVGSYRNLENPVSVYHIPD